MVVTECANRKEVVEVWLLERMVTRLAVVAINKE